MTATMTTSWRAAAACAGKPVTWWFPDIGNNHRQARAVCADCPVRAECLDYALGNDETGLWGGMDDKERSRERRRRNKTIRLDRARTRLQTSERN